VCMQKAPQPYLGGRMPSVARHFRSNCHCNCHCNSNSNSNSKGHCKGRSNGESSSQSSSYRRCRSRGLCPLPHPSTHPNLSRSRSLRQCCRSIRVPVPPAKPAYLPLLRLFPCAPTLCAGASCVGWQGPPPHGCGGGAYMGERALLARHCLACARTHSRQRLGRGAERDLQRALPTHTRRAPPRTTQPKAFGFGSSFGLGPGPGSGRYPLLLNSTPPTPIKGKARKAESQVPQGFRPSSHAH